MKKLLYITLFTLSLYNCKAQIIALETYPTLTEDVPDGSYMKDVNHLLDKYIGVWTGIYDNKTYEFHIEKYTEDNDIGRPLKFDQLRIRYKITNSTTNQVILETLSLPNTSHQVINGQNFLLKADGSSTSTVSYELFYQGFLSDCNQSGSLVLQAITGTSNPQMRVRLFPDRGIINSNLCPNGSEHIMPLEYVIFNKQ